MIGDEFVARVADLNAANRHRRNVQQRLASNAEVEGSQAGANRTAFLGCWLLVRRPRVGNVFETAFMADDNIACARLKLCQGDRRNVDGQHPRIEKSAQNRKGTYSSLELTRSQSPHSVTTSTSARAAQWRDSHRANRITSVTRKNQLAIWWLDSRGSPAYWSQSSRYSQNEKAPKQLLAD